MNPRIVVIGGVAAGPSAASKAKRTNPDAEVTLIEQGEHISYGICEIPYYIGNVFTDPDHLVVHTPESLQREKGVATRTLHRVEHIHGTKKLVEVRDLRKGRMEEIPYDKLIVATGSQPRGLGLPGEDARNVFTVKSLEGAFALKKYIAEEEPRSAVIIGGGYIGMEMAEALISNGIETTILHRRDLPMHGLDTGIRQQVREELARHGVVFKGPCLVRGFGTDKSGRVISVKSDLGQFRCDLVIVAIGVAPSTALAQNARIHLGPHGGITADQRQATSLDSVYAAGDCCETRNIVNNSWSYIPLATVASRQAWVAGENAAGGSATFKGAIKSAAVRVFDLEVARVGLSEEEASKSGFDAVSESIVAPSRVSFFPGSEKVHLSLILDKRSRRVLGASLVGKDGVVLRANTLAVVIQQKMTVEELSQMDLIYTPPYAPLWDPILIAANQLKKRK